MVTVGAFLAELIASVVELVRIFLFEVALSDPLSLVNWIVGVALTTAAVLLLGYLALGALARELGLTGPSGPPERRAG